MMSLGAALLFVGAACSSASTSPPHSPRPSATFAGTYATHVTLGENGCGSVTIQDMPTVVAHDASSGTISLTHAGTRYNGTVVADSSFTTSPTTVNVGDGNSYLLTIAGRFTTNGLTAAVTIDRTNNQSGAQCRYIVNWTGTR